MTEQTATCWYFQIGAFWFDIWGKGTFSYIAALVAAYASYFDTKLQWCVFIPSCVVVVFFVLVFFFYSTWCNIKSEFSLCSICGRVLSKCSSSLSAWCAELLKLFIFLNSFKLLFFSLSKIKTGWDIFWNNHFVYFVTHSVLFSKYYSKINVDITNWIGTTEPFYYKCQSLSCNIHRQFNGCIRGASSVSAKIATAGDKFTSFPMGRWPTLTPEPQPPQQNRWDHWDDDMRTDELLSSMKL